MADPNDFLSRAASPRRSLFREFLEFLRQEKKWWLVPILVTLFVLGLLVVAGGSAAAPFIYTLF
jgi:hypothetical protein